MQLGLLRWAAAYQPTSKEQQSNLYRLESCAEGSLNSLDPFIGRRCVEWLVLFSGLDRDYLFQYVEDCSRRYIRGKALGKERFKKLPDILNALEPLSSQYLAFEEELIKIAKQKGCEPGDLSDRGPWPKFKW
jgi:hypothetical protein